MATWTWEIDATLSGAGRSLSGRSNCGQQLCIFFSSETFFQVVCFSCGGNGLYVGAPLRERKFVALQLLSMSMLVLCSVCLSVCVGGWGCCHVLLRTRTTFLFFPSSITSRWSVGHAANLIYVCVAGARNEEKDKTCYSRWTLSFTVPVAHQ